MYPDFLHGAPPTAAPAAFIKESRMKFANASKVYRKSGVRLGERGAPVRLPLALTGAMGREIRTGLLLLEFPAMDEICPAMADSHHVEGVGLFGVDDVVYSTVNGIRIVVVTNAGP
jgi:hypothetical protein